ncbi:endonuclease/exonuclease/phosphatase family protein [Halosquirtibacter xylanolyticus]|uniref:endonuclease/exonuclease/phosphatase family protein n=1 Tax=Halosquirtibacter xylanolyticus TaxID=3374599 RepID=UPI003747882F|nr:endonuclease/exonuclease/phosphatase family protein [Prolixibacteraceae bacterium]
MKVRIASFMLALLGVTFFIPKAKANIIKTSSRIMTYNIRYDNPNDGEQSWSHRKDGILALIKYHDPQILCVQEALNSQVKDLKSGLDHYGFVGVGRDDGQENGEYAGIFYDKDKYSRVEDGHFWLSATSNKASIGWDAACIRICTWVKLRDKMTRKLLVVFNTHFDHVGKKAQSESAKLIVSKIRELTEQGKYSYVLTGDFNMEPQANAIQYLSKKYDDAKKVSYTKPYGPNGTFNRFDFNHPLDSRIDYIFVKEGLEVEHYAVLSDSKDLHYYSDHLPVVIDLRY